MTGQDKELDSDMADKHMLYGTCPVNLILHLSEYTVDGGPPTTEVGQDIFKKKKKKTEIKGKESITIGLKYIS